MDLNDQFGYYDRLLNVDGSPLFPSPIARQQRNIVDTRRVPRLGPPKPPPARHPFEMHPCRPKGRHEEPEHRGMLQPSPASSQADSCITRPTASDQKLEAAMPKAPEHPAQSKLYIAKGMTTTAEIRLDPARSPELTWPWQWAYVPSTTTTNTAANVLVPVNCETQQIHPSYYQRFPSAGVDTPVRTNKSSARRDLPPGRNLSRLQSISVDESAASAYISDPTRATNAIINNKSDLPCKKADLLCGDKLTLPDPSIESSGERYHHWFNPNSTSKPHSPVGPRRPPDEGAPIQCPPYDKDPGVSACLSARMESLHRDRQQACSNKDLDELIATTEQKGQTSSDLFKMHQNKQSRVRINKNLQVLHPRDTATQKAEDAPKSIGTPSAKDVAPTHLSLPVPKTVSAQTAGKVTNGGIEELRKRSRMPLSTGATLTYFEMETEKHISVQAASKHKTSEEENYQGEFVDLSLESDEEGWEKVDGDDEWEVIDDPIVEVERKANLQSTSRHSEMFFGATP